MRLFRTYYSLTNFTKTLLWVIPLTIAWYFLPLPFNDYLVILVAGGYGLRTFNKNEIR